MKIKYKPKNTGYITIPRKIQGLLKCLKINFTNLGAYISFVCQADWDKRHTNYRAILADDDILANYWGYDISTVYRQRKKLIKVGLLEEKDGITFVKNLDIFNIRTTKALAKKECNITDLHTYFVKSEKELAMVMFGIENMPEVQD